jgi:hypothetical protein
MIRGTFVLVALILLGAVTAPAANAFDEAGFPPEVRESLKYAHEECGEGGKVTFAPETVRKLDLTGDGRPDYIVDFGDTQCAERASVYCGTGGCSMDILVTLPDGKIRTVFSARARSYEILPGKGARSIRFELHGSFCGRSGNPSCIKIRRITAKPFEFKEP